MTLLAKVLVLAAIAASAGPLQAQPAASSRGQLLYDTHCIECHNTQVHWRELRQATDWNSLKQQVRRWQQIGRLGWDESDVELVSRYLNRTIYRFDDVPLQVGSRSN
jgi:hypothetical protein